MTRKPAELKDEEILALLLKTPFAITPRAIATAATRKFGERILNEYANGIGPETLEAIRKEIPDA